MSSGFVKAGESADSFREDKFKAIREELKSGVNNVTPANRDKSLYEVLQENREKKQEAAEKEYQERNDIHLLGDDEIAYLDSLRVKQLNNDKTIKQEISDSLSQFHEQRQVNELTEGNISIIENQKKFLPSKILKKRKPGALESSISVVVKKAKRKADDNDVHEVDILKKDILEKSYPTKDDQRVEANQGDSGLNSKPRASSEGSADPTSDEITQDTDKVAPLPKAQEKFALLSSLGDYGSDSDSE